MNGFDVAALAVLAVAMLLGLSAGLVRCALGLLSVVAGAVAAVSFADRAARWLSRWIGSTELQLLVGCVAVFAATLLAFTVLAWLLRRTLERIGLGWADRALGALMAAAAVVLLAAPPALLLTRLLPRSGLVRESSLLAPLSRLAEQGGRVLPRSFRARADRFMTQAAERLGDARSGEGAVTPPPGPVDVQAPPGPSSARGTARAGAEGGGR